MTVKEELYNELRDIYHGKMIISDSINKGKRIAKIIFSLLDDIAYPLVLNQEVKIGNVRFDGLLLLGGGHEVPFEIHIGTLSSFRYSYIFETVSGGYFSSKTHLLIIAHDFSSKNKEEQDILLKKIDRIEKRKPTITFIDYETLISLHKFSEEQINPLLPSKRNSQYLKRFFLQELFTTSPIVSSSFFENSLEFAKEKYMLKEKNIENRREKRREQIIAYRSIEDLEEKYEAESSEFNERLRNVERIAESLLNQIKELRSKLQRRKKH